MATTPTYTINYEDERFKEVEADKNEAISEVDKTYGDMISESDKYYQGQIEASKQWAEQQKQNQQAQTDLLIEQTNQQKDKAEKDYRKEQTGAYVDWQKQSNQYGANAEQMAAQGLANTGFSESSQVSMFNTYQNRVTTAREVYNQAVQNFNNSIQEARLANNSKLAEIAYNALQQSLQLSLEGFQYKNTLILDQINKQQETEDRYYARWQDVQSQINTENALAEQIRQYNETLAEQKRQADLDNQYKQQALALQREQFNWQKAQASASRSSGGSSSSKLTGSSGSKQTTSNNTLNNNNNNNNNTSSGTVKLSNGKTGYSSYATAYKKAGGKGPLNEQGVLKSGKVKKVSYNGKSYYYVV